MSRYYMTLSNQDLAFYFKIKLCGSIALPNPSLYFKKHGSNSLFVQKVETYLGTDVYYERNP